MKHRSHFAAWMAALIGLVTACAGTPLSAASELTGQVMSKAGTPVEGATVFIFTAAPKTGTSPFCPSCYPDCGKTAKSDASGNFAISGLSSQLIFRLLVVAKAHVPQYVPKVEPGLRRVDVVLEPRRDGATPPEQAARGRIVDRDGAPIFGAVIEANGVDHGDGRRSFGSVAGLEPLAVTDEGGEFILTAGSAVAAILVRVSARAFANKTAALATGKHYTIKMSEGAKLSGRVMVEGKPLPGVSVGVSAQNRRAGEFVGHFEVGTDADGKFSFVNLPSKTDYYIYGLIETVGPYGVIPMRSVHVGREGETTKIGDLAVRPGFRLAGRVVLDDGERVPPNTRLLIGRDRAWDACTVELDLDGRFEIPGIPAEVVTLSVRVPGYQLSSKNQSYDPANRRLIGRVDADVVALEMLMEKSAPPQGRISTASLPRPKPGERPQDRPLGGVESHLR